LHLAAEYFNKRIDDFEPNIISNNNRAPSPGNDFNSKATWDDILVPHGWVVSHSSSDLTHWTRPGKESGTSATTGAVSDSGTELFCSFSSNASPFHGANGSRSCSSYSKFAAHTVLNHGGDYKAAAAELAAKGYGPQKLIFGEQEATQTQVALPPVEKYTLAELGQQYPTLRSPVLDGLFREGETCNIISASKIGKSWLAYNLLISVVTGRSWLDRFSTSQGKVLLIDNELHRPTLAQRIPRVGDAMGLFESEYMDDLDIWPLRGRLRSLVELGTEFEKNPCGKYKLILFDAKYRFASLGTSENDNTAETLVYNLLDQYAEKLGAALVLIHHSSKGSQSDKRVTDVGSGAGAQSRAADCHLVLREHEEADTVVLDAAVRSFKPVEPVVLRWEFPLWTPDEFGDAKKLKERKTAGEQRVADRDKEGTSLILATLTKKPNSIRGIMAETEMSKDRVIKLVDRLEAKGFVTQERGVIANNKCDIYSLTGDPV
jgi:RecA-family ATPase